MKASEKDEINEIRKQEESGLSASNREAPEKRRQIGILMGKAKPAKKANDARAFAEQLRGAGILEDSPGWKKAWDYFYGRS